MSRSMAELTHAPRSPGEHLERARERNGVARTASERGDLKGLAALVDQARARLEQLVSILGLRRYLSVASW